MTQGDAQRPEPVLFLHGVGETPQAWHDQVVALPAGYPMAAPWLLGARPGKPAPFDLESAAASVVTEIDRLGAARARLCGASLGGNVAMRVAVDYPDRVSRLVVSAGTVTPPRVAMNAQRALFRLYPRRKLADQGIDKDQMLALMKELGRIDFVGGVEKIAAPTLVLVGTNDAANKPGAQWLAAKIPGATVAEVPGAGTRPHVEAAEAFNELAIEFLTEA